jgi:hypothetical protein
MNSKESFYKIYANLPLPLRDEIVVVIDGEPMTWRIARIEVDGDTPTSLTILDNLTKMNII